MKVGIITFHFTTNQGATLQCYALKTWLEIHGHEVQVINYRPAYHTIRYTPYKNPFYIMKITWKKYRYLSLIKRLYATVIRFISAIKGNIKHSEKEKYNIFSSFLTDNLKETKKYPSLK